MLRLLPLWKPGASAPGNSSIDAAALRPGFSNPNLLLPDSYCNTQSFAALPKASASLCERASEYTRTTGSVPDSR